VLVSAPPHLMPKPLCPDCGSPGRALDLPFAKSTYVRCDRCFTSWAIDRDRPDAPPRVIARVPKDSSDTKA